MESRNRKMGRRMGSIMPKKYINGLARDIETIVRLRPWIEDEWKAVHGNFKNTILKTEYDAVANIFSFQIIFNI